MSVFREFKNFEEYKNNFMENFVQTFINSFMGIMKNCSDENKEHYLYVVSKLLVTILLTIKAEKQPKEVNEKIEEALEFLSDGLEDVEEQCNKKEIDEGDYIDVCNDLKIYFEVVKDLKNKYTEYMAFQIISQ